MSRISKQIGSKPVTIIVTAAAAVEAEAEAAVAVWFLEQEIRQAYRCPTSDGRIGRGASPRTGIPPRPCRIAAEHLTHTHTHTHIHIRTHRPRHTGRAPQATARRSLLVPTDPASPEAPVPWLQSNNPMTLQATILFVLAAPLSSTKGPYANQLFEVQPPESRHDVLACNCQAACDDPDGMVLQDNNTKTVSRLSLRPRSQNRPEQMHHRAPSPQPKDRLEWRRTVKGARPPALFAHLPNSKAPPLPPLPLPDRTANELGTGRKSKIVFIDQGTHLIT
ncbi:hypothetical protein CDEST_06162 [Colletotrichum destructivum]|uniref:Uncharacterized protein n=1 Tax=Colletotrichum destructivum TaxID=34406 RepID=A0AAX4IDW2_9PEZI|nr:hypothetical protein CDEST_06162 [Colletotrichum destructivum]